MKKLILFWLAVSVSCLARAPVQNWCQNGNVTVNAPAQAGQVPVTRAFQQSYPYCTVTVYITGSSPLTKATIYSDNNGTSLSNPFTASVSGLYTFYVDDGDYDVKVQNGGIPTPFTLGSIPVTDPFFNPPSSWSSTIKNETKNAKLANTIELTDFVLTCTGLDITSAFQAAITAAAAIHGRLHVPACSQPWLINASALSIPSPVIVYGDGWSGPETPPNFGSFSWLTTAIPTGSVIQQTGNYDIVDINGALPSDIELRDLALLGPGSGTTACVNVNPNSGSFGQRIHMSNVALINCYYGLESSVFMIGSDFDRVTTWGNNTGKYITNFDNLNFTNDEAQSAVTCFLIGDGNGLHIWGRLYENCSGTGVKIAPPSAGAANISVEAAWFESNGVSVDLDAASFGITSFSLAWTRNADAGNILTMEDTAGMNNVTFIGNQWGGATVTIPAGVTGAAIDNLFSSITNNSTANGYVFTVLDSTSQATFGSVGVIANANICTDPACGSYAHRNSSTGDYAIHSATGIDDLDQKINMGPTDQISFLSAYGMNVFAPHTKTNTQNEYGIFQGIITSPAAGGPFTAVGTGCTATVGAGASSTAGPVTLSGSSGACIIIFTMGGGATADGWWCDLQNEDVANPRGLQQGNTATTCKIYLSTFTTGDLAIFHAVGF